MVAFDFGLVGLGLVWFGLVWFKLASSLAGLWSNLSRAVCVVARRASSASA